MRKLTLIAPALLLSLFTFSQARFGIKAGLNYSEINSDNNQLDFYNGNIGAGLGMLYELPITDQIAVQPELSVSYRQAKANYSNQKLSTTYFEVPVLFKYIVPKARLAFLGGPQLSFLSNASYTFDGGEGSDWKTNLISTDFGVAVGVEHRPDKAGMLYGLRVTKGLGNVMKSEYDGGTRSRSTVIGAFFGFLF